MEEIGIRAKIAAYLDEESLIALSETSKLAYREMLALREYNLFWKQKLEQFLLTQSHNIPEEGLPFTSGGWHDVFIQMRRRMPEVLLTDDDNAYVELLFGDDHFVANLALYLHLGQPYNKPWMLSLAIKKGYADIVRGILEQYPGSITGYCEERVLGGRPICFDPFADAVYMGDVNIVRILLDGCNTATSNGYIDTDLAYIAMAMGNDDIATLVQGDAALTSKCVDAVLYSREGSVIPSGIDTYSEDNYILAVYAAMFHGQVDLLRILVTVNKLAMLDNLDILEPLVRDAPNAEVFQVMYDRIPVHYSGYLIEIAKCCDRFDVLNVLDRKRHTMM